MTNKIQHSWSITIVSFSSYLAVSCQTVSAQDPSRHIPLSEYSTEELIEEYNVRFDHALVRFDELEFEFYDVVGNLPVEMPPEDRVTTNDTIDSTYAEIYELFRPFASAGDIDAQVIVGGLGLFQSKSYEDFCTHFELIFDAAIRGNADGAYFMSEIYRLNLNHVGKNREELADLWLFESARRNPYYEEFLKPKYRRLYSDDVDALKDHWISWSYREPLGPFEDFDCVITVDGK